MSVRTAMSTVRRRLAPGALYSSVSSGRQELLALLELLVPPERLAQRALLERDGGPVQVFPLVGSVRTTTSTFARTVMSMVRRLLERGALSSSAS